MQQEKFLAKLVEEFDVKKDTLRCYTLESNYQIRIILFGKEGCSSCYIGLLINKHFHVIGLGTFQFMDEDAKALLVSLTSTLPQDEQKLIMRDYFLFDEEEQQEIEQKINQIFQNEQ